MSTKAPATTNGAGEVSDIVTWHRRTFYISDEMARAASVLASDERRRLRVPQYGAGRIVERALREFIERHMTPAQLDALLTEYGDGEGGLA